MYLSVPAGPENVSIEVNHVSHEMLWEARAYCIRHREISKEKFDSSSDFYTLPLQVGCYYFCCTDVKRVAGLQVADLSQTNRTDIMNDDERWMGSDRSGPVIYSARFLFFPVYKNQANFQLKYNTPDSDVHTN